MKIIRVIVISIFVFSSCGFDPASVRARAGAPDPAVVDEFNIPLDSSLPKYVLAVEEVPLPGTTTDWTSYYSGDSQVRGGSSASVSGRKDTGSTTDFASNENSTTRKGAKNFTGSPAVTGTPPIVQNSPDKSKQKNSAKKGPAGSIPVAFEETSGSLNNQPNNEAAPAMSDELTVGGESTKGRAVNTGTEVEKKNVNTRTGSTSKSSHYIHNTRINTEITEGARDTAAQFVSSLSSIDNFSVRNFKTLKSSGGLYSATLRAGEVGPFIVRAVFTEYQTRVVDKSSKINLVTLVKTSDDLQEGVVGLDVSVMDGRTGEFVTSFPVQGTFSSRNQKFGVGVLIPLSEQKQFAQSVLAQARRNALNEAAKRIFEVLKTKVSG